jgi:hypothetical protein
MAKETMTTTEHLLRQYAVTMDISKQHFESMHEFMRDEIERRLRIETEQISMNVQSIKHHATPSVIFTEDGEPIEIVKLACIATGFMPVESAEQTLRKIEIDNAQAEWTEEE